MNPVDTMQALEGRRILLTGAGGQVGIALQRQMPSGVELLALDRQGLDITDAEAVADIARSFRPDCIINAAAYTAVDKAESEPEAAFAINRDGAANLARAAESVKARMVQISTDYVFDGRQARPYRPDDPVNPINVYGESKLAGEVATREILGEDLLILRTAWVYSAHGKNFLTTMLRLMRERVELKVVEDQVGTPTSADSLARVILSTISHEMKGVHHWTDAGVATWYDFACAIYDMRMAADLCVKRCDIVPIQSTDYATLAKRPGCSLLDKRSTRESIDVNGVRWENELGQVISRLADVHGCRW
jgi:dTDP-4-dehydrorhamnose reductase